MLKIVYNNLAEIITSFNVVSDHVIELGDMAINRSGFKAYRDTDELFLGDYSAYTTVYRQTDEGTQYSDDGSVYVEPEPIEPIVPIDLGDLIIEE